MEWIKNHKIIVVLLFFIFLVALLNGTGSKKTTNKNSATKNSNATTEESAEFEIVYELNSKRFDKGTSLYVLVPQVDLSNDSFKNKLKSAFKKIVSSKGNNISVEVYDNKELLELGYKQYGDLSLGRPRTEEENKLLAIHLIATYDGNLSTNIYPNTLSFFPNAIKSEPSVGGYVETLEYDASK